MQPPRKVLPGMFGRQESTLCLRLALDRAPTHPKSRGCRWSMDASLEISAVVQLSAAPARAGREQVGYFGRFWGKSPWVWCGHKRRQFVSSVCSPTWDKQCRIVPQRGSERNNSLPRELGECSRDHRAITAVIDLQFWSNQLPRQYRRRSTGRRVTPLQQSNQGVAACVPIAWNRKAATTFRSHFKRSSPTPHLSPSRSFARSTAAPRKLHSRRPSRQSPSLRRASNIPAAH